MTKLKSSIYNQTNSISFWAVILVTSLLPVALARLSIDLYLLPQIEIGIVFFLSIYCRTRPWQFFLYGIFMDIAYGNPIGTLPFIMLALNYIIHKFKANLSKQDMMTIFIYFICTAVAIMAFKHIIFSLKNRYDYTDYYYVILVNLVVNIIYYPMLHWILSHSAYLKKYENQ